MADFRFPIPGGLPKIPRHPPAAPKPPAPAPGPPPEPPAPAVDPDDIPTGGSTFIIIEPGTPTPSDVPGGGDRD